MLAVKDSWTMMEGSYCVVGLMPLLDLDLLGDPDLGPAGRA